MSTLASQAGPSQAGPSQSDPGQSTPPSGKGGSGGPGQTGGGGEPSGPPKPTRSGWPKLTANRGDEVTVAARLLGFAPGTPVTFKIYPVTGEPEKALSTVKGESDASGMAWSAWTVKFDPQRHTDPRLVFQASVASAAAISGIMTVVDWAELALKGEDGHPLANFKIALIDAVGKVHELTTNAQGHVRREMVPVGQYSIKAKDYLVDGEKGPGQKKFDTGKRQDVKLKKMIYTIEFTEPKEGDVYLAGDRVELKTIVKRDGKEEKVAPDFTAKGTPSAKIAGGAAGEKDAKGAGSTAVILNVGEDEGEIGIVAEVQGFKSQVKIKVVKPYVSKLELLDNDSNLFPVYDHKQRDRTLPQWEFGQDGKPTKRHAAAVKFGTKLKARLHLKVKEKPSKPAKIVLAMATPPVANTPPGVQSLVGPLPMYFFLPDDKQKSGFEWNGDENTGIDLESKTPLPKFVRFYDWKLDVRVAGPGAIEKPADFQKAEKLGTLDDVKIFAVWGKPAIGGGKLQDPGTEPLGSSEFDAYHLRLVTEWADGAWSLKLEGPGSIPDAIEAKIGHPRWPDQYDGKLGKAKHEHPRPSNAQQSQGSKVWAPEPLARPSIIAYRCEKHHDLRFGHPSQVSTHCMQCHKYYFIWLNGGYQDGMIACNFRTGDRRMDTCPGCHLPKSFLEVQCSACKEWVSEKAFMTGEHDCQDGAEPTQEGKGPIGKNWGFAVIDNPDHPGGEPHQAASLFAAALNALGIKAVLWYKKRKRNGKVKRVWVAIPADTSRDGDFPGQKVHEDEIGLVGPPIRGGKRRRILRRIEEALDDDEGDDDVKRTRK